MKYLCCSDHPLPLVQVVKSGAQFTAHKTQGARPKTFLKGLTNPFQHKIAFHQALIWLIFIDCYWVLNLFWPVTRAVQASKILENAHFKWHSESYFCFKYLSVCLSFLCINSYVCICAEMQNQGALLGLQSNAIWAEGWLTYTQMRLPF